MIEEFEVLDGMGCFGQPSRIWIDLRRVVMVMPHPWKGRTVTAAYFEINKGLVLDIEPEQFVKRWHPC